MHLPRKPFKVLMEVLFDVRVYSTRPHGRDDCHDIQGTGAVITTIPDVGANDGVSAIKFLTAFPAATIHSFEPVTKTFDILRKNVASHKEIYCHQLAVGASLGVAQTPASATKPYRSGPCERDPPLYPPLQNSLMYHRLHP